MGWDRRRNEGIVTVKILSTGSKGNCYLLKCNGSTLILDAGIPIKEIKIGLDFDLTQVAGVFISHSHKDHLLAAEDCRKNGLRIIEPYLVLKPSLKHEVGGWTLYSFPLPHDGVENRGCLIFAPDGTRILYLTDFEYCKYSFKRHQVDLILVECNYQEKYLTSLQSKAAHVVRGHCEEQTMLRFLEENKSDKLKAVILIHLSFGSCNPEEVKASAEGIVDCPVYVAEKGMEVDVD